MPGLYAVGEISCGSFYHDYPGGAGLTKGAIFGRIVGQAVVRRRRDPQNVASLVARLDNHSKTTHYCGCANHLTILSL